MKRFFLFFMLLSVCLCAMSQASGEYSLICGRSCIYDRDGNAKTVSLDGFYLVYDGGSCHIISKDKKVEVYEPADSRYQGWVTTQVNDGEEYYSIRLKLGKNNVFIESTFDPVDYKDYGYNLIDNATYSYKDYYWPAFYDALLIFRLDNGRRLVSEIETVIDMTAVRIAGGDINAKTFVPWGDFVTSLVRTWEQNNKYIEKKRQKMCASLLKESKTKGIKGVAVDLGLSVRWSNINLGQSQPHGNLCTFGWADPTGAKYSDYNEEYPKEKDVYHISGTQYDIASATWGDGWRIPTKAECEELVAKCRFECLTDGNGDSYVKVTGPNGNHIILPFFSCENYGSYWSGTREDVCCGAFDMTVSLWNKRIEAKVSDENNRFCKFFIRPVHD